MDELSKALLTEWAGVPLVIWLALFALLGTIALRVRRFRFKFKDRDRQILHRNRQRKYIPS